MRSAVLLGLLASVACVEGRRVRVEGRQLFVDGDEFQVKVRPSL